MGKYQRNKGARWEREVAALYRAALPSASDGIKRTPQSRAGGLDGSDVQVPCLWNECKVGARPNIHAAMEQAREDMLRAGENRIIVCPTKRDRERPLATLYLEDWLKIVRYLGVGGLHAILHGYGDPDAEPITPKNQG